MKAVQNIFLFFVFFPQVHFGLDFLDSTPFALLIGVILIYLYELKMKMPYVLVLMLSIIYVCLINLLVSQVISLELFIRQLVTILNVVLIAFIFHQTNFTHEKFQKLLLLFSLIYLLAAILQIFGLSLEIISHNRTGGGRGLTSLASEATFFGLFTLVFIIYFWENIKAHTCFGRICHIGLAINFLNLILSSSATAFLFFVLYVLLGTLNIRVVFKYLLIIGVILPIGYLYSDLIEGLRIIKLAKFIVEKRDLVLLILNDGSISERLSAVLFPYLGLVENSMMPGASNTYETLSAQLRDKYEIFWWGSSSKIMNYIGTFVYELGSPFFIPLCIFMVYLGLTSIRSSTFGLFVFLLLIYNTGLSPMSAIFTFQAYFIISVMTKKIKYA